jgi:hypothetical protein
MNMTKDVQKTIGASKFLGNQISQYRPHSTYLNLFLFYVIRQHVVIFNTLPDAYLSPQDNKSQTSLDREMSSNNFTTPILAVGHELVNRDRFGRSNVRELTSVCQLTSNSLRLS